MKIEIDGVEGDYFTAEEVETQKAAAIQEREDDFKRREDELAEIQNPNIKVLRENAKNWEKFVKSGKNLGENGEVIDAPQTFGREDAVQVARQEMLDARKEEYLDGFDSTKREVVEHFYNKLTTGEEVTAKNMRQFITDAAKLADVDAPNVAFNQFTSGRGGAPTVNMGDNKTDFGETEAGKSLAADMGLRI